MREPSAPPRAALEGSSASRSTINLLESKFVNISKY